MLKAKTVKPDAVELRGQFDEPVVELTSTVDGDGTLRVTATVSRHLAEEIIAGLKLLEVVRGATRAPAPSWGAVPPAPTSFA